MTHYTNHNGYSNGSPAAPRDQHKPAGPYAQHGYPSSPPQPPSSSYGAPVYPAHMLGNAPLERPMPSKSPKRWPMARVYMASWATLAVGAVIYIGALAWQNDSPAGTRQELASGTQSIERILARNSSDVADLQRSVGALESDMQRVKSNASAQDEREKQLVERVGVIETRVEQFASALPLITTKAQANQKAADKAKTPTPAVVAQTAAPAKTVQQLANAGAAAIETSSIGADNGQRELAAARAAPPTVVAQKSVGVQVASGPSLDALRLSGSLLSDRHRSSLKTLEPRYVSADGTYQLIAGPLPNDAEAVKICATLRTRGVSCRPAEFKGEGLQ